ncbi:MAG: hypothetical protein AUI14_19030 [Actinobacteria bacterium 13_2_20CM_2_71_6]|nr:MAG: hypothetical protein AUI14_19030 [Actinobacteria bacterium 13_2_20CM_2_71_6]
MALSLAALLIPIFVLLIVYRVVYSGDAPIAVDASGTWDAARHGAHFTVLEPAGLPAKWTVISATFRDGTLRVGYVTPDGTGLQLVESDRPGDELLPAELGTDARPGNLSTIGDRLWRAYPATARGDHALVLTDSGRTTILIGTASDADLRTFAAALR